MTIDLMSYPLGFLAGLLSILSPCVWPLVPVVMSSAATAGRHGPLFLALGLSLSFAFAGTVLSYLLLNLGLGLDVIRPFAALMLILVALPLLFEPLGYRVNAWLARLNPAVNAGQASATSGLGQFGVGALLGVVWLPCVGPTLGAAIALASMGQDMVAAFGVMFVFGVGTVSALLFAGLVSAKLLKRTRPGVMNNANRGKKILGAMLLMLGILVLTGWDKALEAWALTWLPDWAVTL
ncbi:hypothetical protein Q672_06825 [Marinobacter sp. EVN1]|jgi:cytochrome c-type biogenesis protein|uniref:cytochrome c biogenesis CcdA family protein n=1 Tax=Marinobacter sp. EVN1 TaxID=1397532 RepID=UPI0003B90704|nr:cytochrome c biogenesis CcdA family protein [Marinobacter sp. EVN1]ERS81020.1 hypothetical protein Q672_06825 [Marinobacter sp. EVN1]